MPEELLLVMRLTVASGPNMHTIKIEWGISMGHDWKWRGWTSKSMPEMQVTIRKDQWMLAYDLCCLPVWMVLGMWIFILILLALCSGHGTDVWDDWWHIFQQAQQVLPKHSADCPVYLLAGCTLRHHVCLGNHAVILHIWLLPQIPCSRTDQMCEKTQEKI